MFSHYMWRTVNVWYPRKYMSKHLRKKISWQKPHKGIVLKSRIQKEVWEHGCSDMQKLKDTMEVYEN